MLQPPPGHARLAAPTFGGDARFVERLRPYLAAGKAPVVLSDLHVLEQEALYAVADLTQSAAPPVVLASADLLPGFLTELADESVETTPCDTKAFAALHDEPDEAECDSAFTYAGGWPESVVRVADGGLTPSARLLSFVAGLRHRRTPVHDAALLTAVCVEGSTAEVLAECLAMPSRSVLDIVAVAERMGVLRWLDGRLRCDVPAVRDALLSTGAQRAWAVDLLAASPAARRSADGILAALDAGKRVTSAEFRGVIDRLHAHEIHGDLDTWESLAGRCAQSTDETVRSEGFASLARLAVLQGRDHDAHTLAGRTHTRTRPESTASPASHLEMLVGILRFDGLDLTTVADLDAPRVEYLFPRFTPPDAHSDAALRALLLALRGEFDALHEESANVRRAGDVDRYLWALAGTIAGETGFVAGLDRTDIRTNPHSGLAETMILALLGKFVTAASQLGELIGDDWTMVSPLHVLCGTYIATGLDVELTRRLLEHRPDIPPGRFGSLASRVVHARALLVIGRRQEAAEAYTALLSDMASAGLFGVVSVIALDAIEATVTAGRLNSLDFSGVESLDPVDALFGALTDGDVRSAVAAARLQPVNSYRSAQALRLVGHVCGEIGDEDAAARHLTRACAIFDSLGAPVDVARTHKLIRRFDPRFEWRHPGRTANAEGVTGRERDVLALVVKGLTNDEIAAQLHISCTTVKRHVTSLLRRHDVSSRRQLIQLMAER